MGTILSSPLWNPCPFETYTHQMLRNEIRQIQTQSASIYPNKNIRIVICACGRDGKSSTINNILSALEGKYTQTADTGGQDSHVTHQYIEYRMLIGNIGVANDTSYILCDTPGLRHENQEVQTEAITAAIMGKFMSGDTVNYEELSVEGLRQMKPKQDTAACVIFIIDSRKGTKGASDTSVAYESMKSILQFVRMKDIKTACLLTKCDELEDAVKKDIRNIYYSESIEKARRTIEHSFKGFPGDRIFPIVNYTESLYATPNMMVQTLFALKHIMGDIHSSLRRKVIPPK